MFSPEKAYLSTAQSLQQQLGNLNLSLKLLLGTFHLTFGLLKRKGQILTRKNYNKI